MKQVRWIWAVLLVSAGMLAGGCFRNTVSEIELDVPAMKTEACAKVIERAVRGLSEDPKLIAAFRADVEQRKVWVQYDNVRLGRRNIEVAVRHAGFAVNDLPADEAARGQLAAECRGDEE